VGVGDFKPLARLAAPVRDREQLPPPGALAERDHLPAPPPALPIETAEPAPPAVAAPPAGRVPRLTLEGALWAGLILLAVVTRFWDLGSRALHHDESLHAYFSWLFATGGGYVHDPLMHGPFLFHANALVYLLLGDSDASSRYVPALFGVALVALPSLLRGPRHLGRWGALAAGCLFLISPAFLYQSRYIRHDIYTVVGSLVLLIAIFRYLEKPERPWLITMAASLAFLLTNHEIVFGIAAVFFGLLAAALLVGRLRPVLPIAVGTAALAYGLWHFKPGPLDRSLPNIPWQGNPSPAEQRAYYQALFTHPKFFSVLIVLLLGLAAAVWMIARLRDPARVAAGQGWADALFADAPRGSVGAAVREAWRDGPGLAIALAVGLAIFVTLFTSLFTNMYGLVSSTIATDGTLLYWLGQHHVRRGDQPWFYFLVLMPQYELFAVLFGGAATVLTGLQALRALATRRVPPGFFFRGFVAVWFLAIFAALSWAGEKMPWLVIHISLPATLLAAALLGELAERWRAGGARRWGWPETGLLAALLAAAGAWYALAAGYTYGTFVDGATTGGWERAITAEAASRWWLLAVPPAAALALLVGWWAWRGAQRTGAAGLVAVVALLALLQVHLAWRLVYQEGDVPRDMLIYTQTSPDVLRTVHELDRLSAELTGGNGLEILFDDNRGVSWPMQWYLRDFPNARLYPGSFQTPPTAPVVLVGDANVSRVEPMMEGYTEQPYVLRWWFPEGHYRDFAIAPELDPGDSAWQSADQPHGLGAVVRSVVDSLATQLTPEGQQRLYRLFMYRDLDEPIGHPGGYTPMRLYVRNDLVPLWNEIRY